MNPVSSLPLVWRAWSVAKDGNTAEQNEDAWRVELLNPAEGGAGLLIAVADGASEAVYAGAWARVLVNAAEADWPTLSDTEFEERLNQVRRAFAPIPAGEVLPWYVRNKFLSLGSQAALLVATLSAGNDSAEIRVRAISVGDCCLLVLRPNGETCSFPVKSSDDFGLHPALLGNRSQPNLDSARWECVLQPGDVLLAATDAVAKWALQCLESQRSTQLLEALQGLLASPDSVPAAPEPPNGPANPQPSEVDGPNRSLWRSLKRILACFSVWSGSESPASQRPAGQDPTAKPDSTRHVFIDYAQLIADCRAPGSEPRMRNDDATLIACVLLGSVAADQGQSVQHILRQFQLVRAAVPPGGPVVGGKGQEPLHLKQQADTLS